MPDTILKHVPGMKHASAVPVLRAEELSESVFRSEYVANSKPCVIRGAVKHWAAVQNWRDKSHLKNRSGHWPVWLFPSEYYSNWPRRGSDKRSVSFAEAMDYLHAEETKIGIVVASHTTELLQDLGGVSFLTKAEPPFFYEGARYFFFRNAGTTWHYHTFDETLMSQIVGSKKIGLLKTNTPSYPAMRMLFCDDNYYDDPSIFDGFDNAGLEWFSAELDAGDALYIPPLWWHGVITTTQAFGATTAVTWRSPPHVIANTIRQLAAGEIDLIGVPFDSAAFQSLYDVARKMGLERELALACYMNGWRSAS